MALPIPKKNLDSPSPNKTNMGHEDDSSLPLIEDLPDVKTIKNIEKTEKKRINDTQVSPRSQVSEKDRVRTATKHEKTSSSVAQFEKPQKTSVPRENIHEVQQKTRTVKEKPQAQDAPVSPTSDNVDSSKWIIDPKTGKKYKPLPGMSEEAVKAMNKTMNSGGEITYSMLAKYREKIEDFDIDDLNSTAETFLAHLRVPPDKNEIERLRKEKAAKTREQNSKYFDDNKDFLDSEYDDEE